MTQRYRQGSLFCTSCTDCLYAILHAMIIHLLVCQFPKLEKATGFNQYPNLKWARASASISHSHIHFQAAPETTAEDTTNLILDALHFPIVELRGNRDNVPCFLAGKTKHVRQDMARYIARDSNYFHVLANVLVSTRSLVKVSFV